MIIINGKKIPTDVESIYGDVIIDNKGNSYNINDLAGEDVIPTNKRTKVITKKQINKPSIKAVKIEVEHVETLSTFNNVNIVNNLNTGTTINKVNTGTIVTTWNYNGKSFKSEKEMGEYIRDEAISNASSNTLVWLSEPNEDVVLINDKLVSLSGKPVYGKCAYRGKEYEGYVTYVGNKLYVGGEFVKEV